MNAKPLKIALPWLILALTLPLLALSFAASTVEARCPCEDDDDPSPSPPPLTVNVSVDVSPHGAGEVEVAGQLPYDYPFTSTVEASQPVYLEAFPADGYYFVGWSGDLNGNENPTEADISADAEITAHFFPEEIVSEDNRLQIIFPVGTIVQDGDGVPLVGLEIVISELPPPPESDIVGLPYELGPDGTTFDRPATINFSYDHGDIRPGVAEEELVMGYYDDEAAQWQFLPSAVDMANDVVSTLVDHLSTFAVIAPTPPLLPAAFSASALSVYPTEAEIGETVTVSVLVTNSGELEGNYGLTLTINGVVAETREITLAGGSQQVVFSVAEDETGSYSVAVNGLEGSFTVLEAPLFPIALPGAVVWAILGLAIAALVVSAVIFPIALMRRDYY